MICLAVTYNIRAGAAAQAIERFRALTDATRREPGCAMYIVHQSTTDSHRFFLYEQYSRPRGARRPPRVATLRAVRHQRTLSHRREPLRRALYAPLAPQHLPRVLHKAIDLTRRGIKRAHQPDRGPPCIQNVEGTAPFQIRHRLRRRRGEHEV